MKIKLQVIIESDDGQTETVQEVAQIERGLLQPAELGLTLMEAKALLEGVQRVLVEEQIAEYLTGTDRGVFNGAGCLSWARKEAFAQRDARNRLSLFVRQTASAQSPSFSLRLRATGATHLQPVGGVADRAHGTGTPLSGSEVLGAGLLRRDGETVGRSAARRTRDQRSDDAQPCLENRRAFGERVGR